MAGQQRRWHGLVVVGCAVLATGGLLATMPAAAAAPPGASQATGTVTIAHGLRGVLADVRVDGNLVATAFSPDRVSDAMTVPVGTHTVEIWKAGMPASSPPALHGSVVVTAGS